MSGDGVFDVQRDQALQALDWLRESYPEAKISVEVIASEDAVIPVRVQIEIGDGAIGAGHGVAPGVEEAEDRAIVRAAETLGYRARARDGGFDPIPQEDPELQRPAQERVPSPAPQPRAGRSGQLGPAVVTRPRQSGAVSPPPPSVTAPAQTDDHPFYDDDAELEMEDISWTAFWTWARAQGYDTGEAVARAIGRPIQGLSPREVRDLLRSEI